MVTIAIDALDVRLAGRAVVEGVTATIAPGGLVGVVGPNGAGKSTLARAVAGLLPPAAGSVRVDGRDVGATPAAVRARMIAYLPQGQVLEWPLTVARLVALGRLPHQGAAARMAAADMQAVERALAMADMLDLRDRVATKLSGGERARALLARALAVEAPVLVVDEPLAALDPGHQLQVMALLAALAQRGTAVIVVLHDLMMAQRFCTRLLMLDAGRLVADGPPDAVLTPERLAAVYGVRAWTGAIDGRRTVVPVARIAPGATAGGT